jgi:hypothetical protein
VVEGEVLADMRSGSRKICVPERLAPRQGRGTAPGRQVRTALVAGGFILLAAPLTLLVAAFVPVRLQLGKQRLVFGVTDRRDPDWQDGWALAYFGMGHGDLPLRTGEQIYWRFQPIGDRLYGIKWVRPESHRMRLLRRCQTQSTLPTAL